MNLSDERQELWREHRREGRATRREGWSDMKGSRQYYERSRMNHVVNSVSVAKRVADTRRGRLNLALP